MRYGRLSNFCALIQLSTSCPRAELNSSRLFSSVASALQDYINSDHPAHGQKLHSRMLKTGFEPNTNISIKLLILYIKSSNLTYARQMFDELPQRTLTAYNYMIAAYVRHGIVEKSFELVRELCLSSEKPDVYTFSMILKGSTSGNAVGVGMEVHAQIVKSLIVCDDVLCTALVDAYVKSERIDYARRVFDLMLEQNVICSTSMITGYMNKGRWEDAEDVFEKTCRKDVVAYNAMIEGYSKSVEMAKKAIEMYIDMQRADFRPTISTFASIIGACSLLSAYEIGQQIQGQLMKTEFFPHIKIGSALVDMYSKCGQTEDARRVFDYMPTRNVFSWTSMIDGYGKNGSPNEALALFSRMIRERRVVPNYVTFLGALSACSHAGLVGEGMEIFKSMERVYSMRPRMEHYACMVDLFGRAGRLNEALDFIMQMPEKPSTDVWAALLSSCRLHGDVELAQVAANELFKIKEKSRPGAYVALSNTLADAGRWDNVGQLRDLMKARGISKGTGFTWIGTDAGLEAFHAGRSYHRQQQWPFNHAPLLPPRWENDLVSRLAPNRRMPIILVPLPISCTRHSLELFLMNLRVFAAAAAIGALIGLSNYMYSYGVAKLPASTSSLLVAMQLVFTAGFACLVVKQRFTAYSINAVVLLTVGAVVLGIHAGGDRLEGESDREYWWGFAMTVAAEALYGFALPLVELTYKKAEQAVTYTLVMEIPLVVCISVRLFAVLECSSTMISRQYQEKQKNMNLEREATIWWWCVVL